MPEKDNELLTALETAVKYRRLLIAVVNQCGGRVYLNEDAVNQAIGKPLEIFEIGDKTLLSVQHSKAEMEILRNTGTA